MADLRKRKLIVQRYIAIEITYDPPFKIVCLLGKGSGSQSTRDPTLRRQPQSLKQILQQI